MPIESLSSLAQAWKNKEITDDESREIFNKKCKRIPHLQLTKLVRWGWIIKNI